MKNSRMESVANLLGVELEERFNIVGGSDNPYYFGERGLFNSYGIGAYDELFKILNGDLKIEKLPFKPNNGDVYYSVIYNDTAGCYLDTDEWYCHSTDYIRYKCGLVFKTKEEAIEIGIPRMKEIIKEYEQ